MPVITTPPKAMRRAAQRRTRAPAVPAPQPRRGRPRVASPPVFCDVVAVAAPPASARRAEGAVPDLTPPLRVTRPREVSEPGGPPRRSMRRRQVGLAVLIALAIAALLNAGPMLRSAETSPFGGRRDLSLMLLRPLATVSHAIGLDRPRAALDALAGHGGDTDPGSHSQPDVDQGAPLVGGELHPVAASTQPPHTVPSKRRPAAPQGPEPRVPTEQDPLRLWVGGDSVAGFFGFGMDDIAAESRVVAAHSHYKTSTGLSRPDYYDWPAHLEDDMHTYNPEVVAFLVGANDDQPLQVGEQVAGFGSDAWKQEYARRVGAVMDRLLSEHRHVVWVGQPVMRDADFDARMQLMNAIYREQAAHRPGVIFFDSRSVLADTSGRYSPYLPDPSGAQTLMRAPDGIHLTPAGGRRLAQAVLTSVENALANPTPPVENLPMEIGLPG